MLSKKRRLPNTWRRPEARRRDGRQCSEIVRHEGLHHSTVNELLRLTLLEPAIIQAILTGMSLLWFQRNPLPTDWVGQREVVEGFDA